uniref:LAM_G_DOMAIN domain-containing protein n=1 Tax=Macrostomum lignano TaxID=282301 RepID=A0A1I8FFI7_9PLAT
FCPTCPEASSRKLVVSTAAKIGVLGDILTSRGRIPRFLTSGCDLMDQLGLWIVTADEDIIEEGRRSDWVFNLVVIPTSGPFEELSASLHRWSRDASPSWTLNSSLPATGVVPRDCPEYLTTLRDGARPISLSEGVLRLSMLHRLRSRTYVPGAKNIVALTFCRAARTRPSRREGDETDGLEVQKSCPGAEALTVVTEERTGAEGNVKGRAPGTSRRVHSFPKKLDERLLPYWSVLRERADCLEQRAGAWPWELVPSYRKNLRQASARLGLAHQGHKGVQQDQASLRDTRWWAQNGQPTSRGSSAAALLPSSSILWAYRSTPHALTGGDASGADARPQDHTPLWTLQPKRATREHPLADQIQERQRRQFKRLNRSRQPPRQFRVGDLCECDLRGCEASCRATCHHLYGSATSFSPTIVRLEDGSRWHTSLCMPHAEPEGASTTSATAMPPQPPVAAEAAAPEGPDGPAAATLRPTRSCGAVRDCGHHRCDSQRKNLTVFFHNGILSLGQEYINNDKGGAGRPQPVHRHERVQSLQLGGGFQGCVKDLVGWRHLAANSRLIHLRFAAASCRRRLGGAVSNPAAQLTRRPCWRRRHRRRRSCVLDGCGRGRLPGEAQLRWRGAAVPLSPRGFTRLGEPSSSFASFRFSFRATSGVGVLLNFDNLMDKPDPVPARRRRLFRPRDFGDGRAHRLEFSSALGGISVDNQTMNCQHSHSSFYLASSQIYFRVTLGGLPSDLLANRRGLHRQGSPNVLHRLHPGCRLPERSRPGRLSRRPSVQVNTSSCSRGAIDIREGPRSALQPRTRVRLDAEAARCPPARCSACSTARLDVQRALTVHLRDGDIVISVQGGRQRAERAEVDFRRVRVWVDDRLSVIGALPQQLKGFDCAPFLGGLPTNDIASGLNYLPGNYVGCLKSLSINGEALRWPASTPATPSWC